MATRALAVTAKCVWKKCSIAALLLSLAAHELCRCFLYTHSNGVSLEIPTAVFPVNPVRPLPTSLFSSFFYTQLNAIPFVCMYSCSISIPFPFCCPHVYFDLFSSLCSTLP
eukprot:scpid107109/ scgid33130/ 